MLKEYLLIALIKSNGSYTELLNSEDNSNIEIGDTKNSLTSSKVISHEKKSRNLEKIP